MHEVTFFFYTKPLKFSVHFKYISIQTGHTSGVHVARAVIVLDS